MPSYEVKLDMPGLNLMNGHNAMVVEAADATDAKAAAAMHYRNDASWENAIVTEVVAAADMSPQLDGEGKLVPFKLSIEILGPDTNASFEYDAIAADSVDDMGDAMVILLNAHADITLAAYATPNLTLSGIADDIGDHTATVTLSRNGSTIAGFVGAVTDGGIAGAALAVALVPANTPCKVTGSAKS